jgi:hypothetical protein
LPELQFGQLEMKFSLSTILVLGLAAETAVASNWFTRAGKATASHPLPAALLTAVPSLQ